MNAIFGTIGPNSTKRGITLTFALLMSRIYL